MTGGHPPEAWQLTPMRPADTAEVARIHCEALPDGLLSRLGPVFLRHVYGAALGSSYAIGIVARHGKTIGGFLLGATDTRRLFRHIMWRRPLAIGAVLVPTLVREPRLLRKIAETVRSPDGTAGWRPKRGPEGELVAIGVLPAYQARGLGTMMVHELNREFVRKGLISYTVALYSSNRGAMNFYEQLGFETAGEFERYGQMWSRYRMRLGPLR